MKICCSRGAGAPQPGSWIRHWCRGTGWRGTDSIASRGRGSGGRSAVAGSGGGAVSRAPHGKRRARAGRAGEEGAQMETRRWSGENEGRRW